MYFGGSLIQAQLEATGALPVVLGGVSTIGHVDEPQPEFLEEGDVQVIGGGKQVTIETGTLPALAVNAAITVNGEAMIVHRHQRIDDGALTRILCVKA